MGWDTKARRARIAPWRCVGTLAAAGILAATVALVGLAAPAGAGSDPAIIGRLVCSDEGPWLVTWEITAVGADLDISTATQHPGFPEDITDTLTRNPIPAGETAVAHGSFLGGYSGGFSLVLALTDGGTLMGSIPAEGPCDAAGAGAGAPEPAPPPAPIEVAPVRFTG